MPKAQNSPIRMYFLIQATENNGNTLAESECRVCGLRMKGNHASNMERHIRRSHPGIYEKYLEIKSQTFNPENKNHNKELSDKLCEQYLSEFSFDDIVQMKPSHEVKRPRLSPTTGYMKKEGIIDACVELVTVNGRPFSLMNDSGFKMLIDPLIGRICPSLVIDENTIEKHVLDKANRIKNDIINKLKNRMIALKLDCVTHCNRSFLGIHAQIFVKNKFKFYTLAIIEVNVRLEPAQLNEIIWNELAAFEISKGQVYSVTTDSGSNFVSFFQSNDVLTDSSSLPCSSKGENTTELKIEPTSGYENNLEPEVQVVTIFNEIDDADNDLDSYTTEIILEKLQLSSNGEDDDNYFDLIDMKCIGNMLQTAIADAFKNSSDISAVLKEVHNIVKKLHTSDATVRRKLSKYNLPPSDSSSKWKSIHDKIEKILTMKSICVQLYVISGSAPFWDDALQLLRCLKLYKPVAEALQKDQLTLCDVYKLWFNCVLEISKINSSIAKALANEMRLKQDALFENICFLSSVFLDPRFNNMVLTATQKQAAIQHLVQLYNKLSILYVPDESDSGSEADGEDELEKVFRKQENFIKPQLAGNQSNDIELELRNFCDNEPRLKTSESIVQYWHNKRFQYSEIYKLVCLMLSVPATQKSVFSLIPQIKYIFDSKLVSNVDLLNSVLLIRAN